MDEKLFRSVFHGGEFVAFDFSGRDELRRISQFDCSAAGERKFRAKNQGVACELPGFNERTGKIIAEGVGFDLGRQRKGLPRNPANEMN